MIGKLRKHKTTAKAIDQPIDFSVPESTVMLAVYLAVPETENTRRAQNTANGMHRAKLMGKYLVKAPLGFINLTLMDGKKTIVPKEPEAEIIKWAFYNVARNDCKIPEIKKIANCEGLLCSRSHFFRILHNPVYCGLIPVKLNSSEEQMIKGLHEPLISESLFHQVQSIINTKRKTTAKRDDLQSLFFLRGSLTCPVCNRKLVGSISKGRSKKYPYYHCRDGCRTRIDASYLNDCYQKKLQQLVLSNNTIELFKNILEDQNIKTQKTSYLYAQKGLDITGDPEAMFRSLEFITRFISGDTMIYPGYCYGIEPGAYYKDIVKKNIYLHIQDIDKFVKIRMRKHQTNIFNFK
ncbi:hypothetical protein FLACOL7796_04659 [Flavobacterium collinsii]|uniref:Recombinase domain-containing protein n=2 Tax=Flavobacterium collinsii TaxID=1114861 RepID=A0ABM8KQ28_9FLAO|nr:hypothetical protein FLACOL7796_04659 [Flavobacterium collinsii]